MDFIPGASSVFDKIEEFLDRLSGYRHFGDLRYLSDVAEGRFKDVRLLENPPATDRVVWAFRRMAKSFFVPVKSQNMNIYRKKLLSIANDSKWSPECCRRVSSGLRKLLTTTTLVAGNVFLGGERVENFEEAISVDPDEIRAFFNRQEGMVVAKPLRLGYFDYGHVQTAAYTTAVSTADLASDEALKVAPVIYQRHLEKRWDIRVTIIGDSIYAAAIHSQEADSARVDWRRADVELEHKVHALPEKIATACQRLMKALNLRFGAVDLVLAPNGQYYFLEINPNGQWLWLEDKLGFPITNRIMEWLRSS